MMMMMMTKTKTKMKTMIRGRRMRTTTTDLIICSLCRSMFLSIILHRQRHPKHHHIYHYQDHRSHHHVFSLEDSSRAGGTMKDTKKEKGNSVIQSVTKGSGNDFFIRSRFVSLRRIAGYSTFTLIPLQLVYMNR